MGHFPGKTQTVTIHPGGNLNSSIPIKGNEFIILKPTEISRPDCFTGKVYHLKNQLQSLLENR